MVKKVKNMGRWAATGFMVVSALIWLRLEYPVSEHRFFMVCFWVINILAAFGLGVLYDRVRSLSLRDDLTMSYNRRFLAKAMPSLLARTSRKQSSLTITLIDCDDFKKINDENGHHTGDTVLRGISRLLIENIRQEDYLVRWGGDEFLLIASEANQTTTRTILDRLNSELGQMSTHMNVPLSVSVGTATFPSDATRLEDLIRIADHRMYQSKLMRKEAAVYTSLGTDECQEQLRQA
jgi:diguanylate cyclase (GGDEF)-like protein